MINKRTRRLKRICKDDLSLIENYYKAINDNTQTWELHHRFESDKNLSGKELIARNMYYHRPASELIFLTPFEHRSLHKKDKPKSEEARKKQSESMKGKTPWNKGVSPSEESRKKMSIRSLGNKSTTGYKWIYNDKERKMVKSDELEYYLNKGYKLGRKSESQKGKHWINNGIETKLIHKEDLQSYIDKGYKLGRK